MKKTLIFAALAAATMTSCSDFLNPQPEHSFGSESFLESETDLRLYSYGFLEKNLPEFQSLATNIQRTSNVASWGGDEHSDLGFVKNKWNCLDGTMFGYRSQGGWGTGAWGELRSINYFNDNIVRAKNRVDEKIYNHYAGIGRFWRAWFYFDMVQEFENVPYYEHEVKSNDMEALYKTQDSREFVMGKVLEDINFACDNCSDNSTYTNSRTQINKYVALALKARICLYEGTYRKYHTELGLNDSEMWLRESADAAKKLMDSKKFSLEGKYKDLFLKSELGKEVILGIAYATDLRMHSTTWNMFSQSAGSNWSMPRPFICTYLMKDGTPFTNKAGWQTMEYADEFVDRDPRLAATVVAPDYKKVPSSGGEMAPYAPNLNVTYSGYQLVKWALPDGGKLDSQAQSYNSFPMFRFGETLLTYAEAKAELGEFTSDIWDETIGKLRARAGVATTMPATADPYMQNYFLGRCTDKNLLEIRRERGCELAWEGLRYQDMLRWKVGERLVPENGGWEGIYIPEINKVYDLNGDGIYDACIYNTDAKPKDPNGKTNQAIYIKVSESAGIKLSEGDKGYLMYGCNFNLKWEDYMYVRPVPYSAIQNNRNLKQREGWGDI